MPFRSTEEEKAQKQVEREAKARVAQAQQQVRAHAASPVGKAEAASERGDTFFEVRIDVDPSISSSSGSGSSSSSGGTGYGLLGEAVSFAAQTVLDRKRVDPPASPRVAQSTDVLGDIERIGWQLEHAGYVYVQTGSSSTGDTDGYSTTFSGKTVGVYLFRRAAS